MDSIQIMAEHHQTSVQWLQETHRVFQAEDLASQYNRRLAKKKMGTQTQISLLERDA